MTYICNPRAGKPQEGGSGVQGQPELRKRPYLKNTLEKKNFFLKQKSPARCLSRWKSFLWKPDNLWSIPKAFGRGRINSQKLFTCRPWNTYKHSPPTHFTVPQKVKQPDFRNDGTNWTRCRKVPGEGAPESWSYTGLEKHLIPHIIYHKSWVLAHTCNHNTHEAEGGRPWIQYQPGLQNRTLSWNKWTNERGEKDFKTYLPKATVISTALLMLMG